MLGVFSGISETKNGKSEIYFGFGAFVVLLSSSFVVAVVVSTECRRCAPAPSLWVCSVPLPCLCPLSCFACRVACEYGFISHFKGVFRGFWGADVCLYGLGSLRGLWGFCVRERLGGFVTCGVFAFLFVLFAPAFISFPAFLACPLVLCLSSCLPCLFLCHCGVCVFFFPYGCMRKKKGRKVFLRPLLSCCVYFPFRFI